MLIVQNFKRFMEHEKNQEEKQMKEGKSSLIICDFNVERRYT